MRKSNLGLLTGLIVFLGQSTAMAATEARDARCPVRDEREGQGAYAARVHDSCDARWRSFVPARPTFGKAYDDYMRRCEKPCAALLLAGVPSGALLILVGGGALAVAAGLKGGDSSPASP